MSENNSDQWTPPDKFEDGLEKLEKLIDQFEGGDIELKEAMETFKEASKLVDWCNKELQEAENEIKELIKKDEQQFTLEEIDISDNEQE